MVQEVFVVEFVGQVCIEVWWQLFYLVVIVVMQCNVQGYDVFDVMLVNFVVLYGGVCYGEVMQEGFVFFFGCVLEVIVFFVCKVIV